MLCIVVAHVLLVIQLLLSKEVRSLTNFSPILSHKHLMDRY